MSIAPMDTPKRLVCAIVLLVTVQFFSMLGAAVSNYLTINAALAEVKQRISLDLSRLDIGNDITAAVTDRQDILSYLHNLNAYALQHDFPIEVIALNDVQVEERLHAYTAQTNITLLAPEFDIDVVATSPELFDFTGISLIGLTAALVWFWLPVIFPRQHVSEAFSELTSKNTPAKQRKNTAKREMQQVRLFVDLKNKALYSTHKADPVTLQNKPLCFYIALLKYCTEFPTAPLSHNQPVPDILIDYAKDAFCQLIELGHTKRKRPDFSTNLDKTLSEIRAALDEVFIELPAEKQSFYPPRAQGEGSRSRQHSYALHELDATRITFVTD